MGSEVIPGEEVKGQKTAQQDGWLESAGKLEAGGDLAEGHPQERQITTRVGAHPAERFSGCRVAAHPHALGA